MVPLNESVCIKSGDVHPEQVKTQVTPHHQINPIISAYYCYNMLDNIANDKYYMLYVGVILDYIY